MSLVTMVTVLGYMGRCHNKLKTDIENKFFREHDTCNQAHRDDACLAVMRRYLSGYYGAGSAHSLLTQTSLKKKSKTFREVQVMTVTSLDGDPLTPWTNTTD